MKNALRSRGRSCSVLTVVFALMLAVVPAAAQEEAKEDAGFSMTASVDILSQYIWRGYALSKNSAVIQPSVTAEYRGFSLNIWGNLDTDPAYTDDNWNETDFTLSYSREIIPHLTGNIGTAYFSLVGDDSVEVFGGLFYELPWFTFGVTAYREVYNFPGWWVELDVSKNIPLPCYGMSLDLVGNMGWMALEDDTILSPEGDIGDYSALHAGQVLAILNIPVGKHFTVSPKAGVAFPLSDKARSVIEAGSWDGDDTHIFGGINVAAGF